MKIYSLISLLVSVVLVFYLPINSNAANWVNFFKNSEMNHYYENKTMTFSDDNIVQIWLRIVPLENAKFKPFIEHIVLREVDCKHKRYRRLIEATLYEQKPSEILDESGWVSLGPYDFDIAFYKIACLNSLSN